MFLRACIKCGKCGNFHTRAIYFFYLLSDLSLEGTSSLEVDRYVLGSGHESGSIVSALSNPSSTHALRVHTYETYPSLVALYLHTAQFYIGKQLYTDPGLPKSKSAHTSPSTTHALHVQLYIGKQLYADAQKQQHTPQQQHTRHCTCTQTRPIRLWLQIIIFLQC